MKMRDGVAGGLQRKQKSPVSRALLHSSTFAHYFVSSIFLTCVKLPACKR